jgi:hypothetical protein
MAQGEGKGWDWRGAVAALGLVTAPEKAGAQPQQVGVELIGSDASADERLVVCEGRNIELRPGDVRWANPGADPFSARGEGLSQPRIDRAFELFRGANVLTPQEEALLRAAMQADRDGSPGVIMPGCRLNAMVFGGGVEVRGKRTEERIWPRDPASGGRVVFAPDAHQMVAGQVGHHAEALAWTVTTDTGERLTLILSEACNNFGVVRGPAPTTEAPDRVEAPNCAESEFRMNGVEPAREGHRLDLRYYIVGQEGVTLPPSVCAGFENAVGALERLPTLDCHPNCPPELITSQIERIMREEGTLARGVELEVLAQHVITNVDERLGPDGFLTIFEDQIIAERAIIVMCVVEVDERTNQVTRTSIIKFSQRGDYDSGSDPAQFGSASQPWRPD